MNPDSIISLLLTVSINGVGLLIAVFSLIVPMIPRIIKERRETYESELKVLRKSTSAKSKIDSDQIMDNILKIKEMENPLPFTFRTVMLSIVLYTVTAMLCIVWLFGLQTITIFGLSLEIINFAAWLFSIATVIFLFIAYQIISIIFNIVDKEYQNGGE